METSILIQNLKCGGCAKTITRKLSTLKNISNVKVDVNQSSIFFYFLHKEDVLKVKKRLKELGYPSFNDSNSFSSKAKSFISCASGKLTK